MTIEERIERVEKQNRRLKWGMTVICVVAAGAFVLGQARPKAVPDVIRAKRFEVVNEAGLAVVRLRSFELGGWIETRNHQGELLFRVGANDDGAGILSTFNANGKELVSLGEAVDGGTLSTYNAEGKQSVILGALKGGGGALGTYNAEGMELVRLGALKGGFGGLSTYNAEGKELVSLGETVDGGVMNGTGAVTVYDPTGRTRRGVLATRP